MESKSLLTGKTYTIPTNGNDRPAIDAFVQQHQGKKVVVVQGLGFVGAVMSLICANALTEEYAVIGIDLATSASYWKIKEINAGQFPIVSSDPKVEQFYQQAREKGNLLATHDVYAYSKADVIIVDINLDVVKQSGSQKVLEGYDVDLTPFKKAIKAIGDHCQEEVLILVETTVPPGTCQHVVLPLIEKCFQERGLAPNYKIGHSYERVMPGPNYIDSIQNFYRVFSGINAQSEQAVEQFLRTIISTKEYPLTKLAGTNATEMAKVLENSFRAMNIAFMEEWGSFAEEAGVNIYEVVQAIRMRPTHKNIMLPGLGVGGYCLTKDPLLASWAKQEIFGSEEGLVQSEQAVRINDQMPLHAVQLLEQTIGELEGKKILLLGVSYLNDVGDTRYTPTELFLEELEHKGAKVVLHDSYVTYWEEKERTVATDLPSVLEENYDAIVITTMHTEYKDNSAIKAYLSKNPSTAFIDTWGIVDCSKINNLPNKIKVLGRGDI